MIIKILCSRGSNSAKLLADGTGLDRVIWKRGARTKPVDLLINWGIFKEGMIYRNNTRIINETWPGNKLRVISKLIELDCPCPAIKTKLDEINEESWIYKPFLSRGGHGIYRLTADNLDQANWDMGYAQAEVLNRRYEVRVSAFNWISPDEWGVWKKTVENRDQLTWNHEQGGKFIAVQRPLGHDLFIRCMKTAAFVLKTLNLQFGAIDFIVSEDWQELFLEINLKPGFTEDYGAEKYINAFTQLQAHNEEAIDGLLAGERHNDIEAL